MNFQKKVTPIAVTPVTSSSVSGMFNAEGTRNEQTALASQTAGTTLPSFSSPVVTHGVGTIMASSADPLSFLTVQNQNGQVIIQQPLKTNSMPSFVNNDSLPKGHIVVKQRPSAGVVSHLASTSRPSGVVSHLASTSLSSSSSSTLLTDVALDRAGVKRPLTSTGNNMITKVIITKNPLSGQPQPIPAGSTPHSFTVTSLPSASGNNAIAGSSHNTVVGTPTKTVTLTSQGLLSPGKTVIATVPGGAGTKINVPYHKIPISPTKITMIPVSRSPNKQSLNSSSITVLSRALNTLAQTGNVAIKPGSPSKVIIKQGPAVSDQNVQH